MSKNIKISLIIVILMVVALLAAFWATTYTPFAPLRPRPPANIRGDIELFYMAKTVISTLNATLLIFLLAAYVDIFIKTKSEFTIGLIMFSMILFAYAIFSNPFIQSIFGFHAFGLGPFAMLPDMFAFGALVVLLYLTFRY